MELAASGLSADGSTPNFTSLTAGGGLLELVRSADGGLWSSDPTGAFHRINSTIMLPSPVRVIDTRSGKGGIAGPLASQKTYTSSDLTKGTGIPAGTVGVVGTLTMLAAKSGTTLGGSGYLAIFPGGTAWPGTVTITGNTSFDNATGCTVGLGSPSGSHPGAVSLYADVVAPIQALLDVVGYIY